MLDVSRHPPRKFAQSSEKKLRPMPLHAAFATACPRNLSLRLPTWLWGKNLTVRTPTQSNRPLRHRPCTRALRVGLGLTAPLANLPPELWRIQPPRNQDEPPTCTAIFFRHWQRGSQHLALFFGDRNWHLVQCPAEGRNSSGCDGHDTLRRRRGLQREIVHIFGER